MRRVLLVCLGLFLGCGNPPGSAKRSFDRNGDGTSDGFQFDLDGDGTYDAVDFDGDGTWEAGDFNEDGTVTVFEEQGRGYTPPTAAQLAGWSPDVDPDFNDTLDPAQANQPTEIITAASVDLTAKLPAILNQGQMGSCAAFANTIVGSLARSRAENTNVVISPAFLYERMLKASNTNCKDGTYIHTGLETLMSEGAPTITEVPYSDAMCLTGSTAGANGQAAKIGGYSKLEPFNRARLKEVLSEGTPVVFGATLPPNFMKWAGPVASGVFKSDNGQAGGPHGGDHAMAIVGYDDSKGAWKVQNSWGTDWGDSGYMWWDYADLESRDGFHVLIPTLLKATVIVEPNVTAATLTLKATGAVQYAEPDGTQRLAVRLQANTEVQLTSVAVESLSASVTLDQGLIYGDVVLPLASPAAQGTYDVTVGGSLAGTSFSKSVTITLGAPEVDPDAS